MNKENNEKPYFLRRLVAYLIDLILVSLLAGVISLLVIKDETYNKDTERLMQLTKDYSTGELTKEQYTEQFDDLNYQVTKEGVGITIVNCSVALVYYVILCYFCHGITLGKYIMKLQIVSAKDKELNMGNYLLRGLLVNLILSNIASIICVYAFNKETFIAVYPKISTCFTFFILASLLFMMYRNDGRGLHDLIANTKIISTKEPKIKKEATEEIQEAKVIEEKKKVKETKKSAKKATKASKKTGGKK